MNLTDIEWCDRTFNPITGCEHNCPYCYARGMARRFKGWDYSSGMVRANIADDKTFITFDTENFHNWDCKVYEVSGYKVAELEAAYLIGRGNKTVKAPYPFGFMPTLHSYKLKRPTTIKTPSNVFVGSMADNFGEWVSDKWIKAMFDACAAAPQHNYLFLTKNPARYEELAQSGKLPSEPNFWYGSTITTPDDEFYYGSISADGRRKRFLSIEPLLAPFEPTGKVWTDWIIIGAETGNRKGKVVPQREWVENIVNQCRKSQIPVFMKDSLLPIMGADGMRREFPEQLRKGATK